MRSRPVLVGEVDEWFPLIAAIPVSRRGSIRSARLSKPGPWAGASSDRRGVSVRLDVGNRSDAQTDGAGGGLRRRARTGLSITPAPDERNHDCEGISSMYDVELLTELGLDVGEQAGESRPWERGDVPGQPQLSTLLSAATVTPVRVDGLERELLCWGPVGDRRGWLCELPPPASAQPPVHPTHSAFWRVCGGIVDDFDFRESYLSNHREILTRSAIVTTAELDEAIEAYSWIWEQDALPVPRGLSRDYYVVAVEANFNLTLAHRENGSVLLFAPDHAFDGLTSAPDCPEYSLYTIDAAPDLASWIETISAAWA